MDELKFRVGLGLLISKVMFMFFFDYSGFFDCFLYFQFFFKKGVFLVNIIYIFIFLQFGLQK